MPTEDAEDQIDHSEILQVTSPEKKILQVTSPGFQPWELFRNLAPLWCPVTHGSSICGADCRPYHPQEHLGEILKSQLGASGNSALNITDELNAGIFPIFMLLLEKRSV